MRRRIPLMMVAALLTLVLSPLAAGGQQPPGPTTRHQFRAAGLPAAGPMEVVTWVLDFAPGAATPPHTHPGLLLATVLEGETTFSRAGTDKVYRPGESLIEVPGEVGLARNTGAGRARTMISLVAPKGAPPSTPQPGGPSPAPPATTNVYLNRTDAIIPPGPYEVVQVVQDYAPGAWGPPHTHPGQVVITVIAGAMTLRSGTTETVYQTGESWVEVPGGPVQQGGNAGAVPATLMITFLLPQGAPLSIPAAAMPGLPATGSGGERRLTPSLWLLVLAGTGLGAGGWVGWRRLLRAR
jgi:quercetin dioxygenase-like cupin family protein